MSMKRRKSDSTNKRLEYQLYLAKENPEPIFDLSNCELEHIPTMVGSLCKVLLKETLLLNMNKLTSLKKISDFQDLILIRVLDLSHNLIETLPNEIGALKNLQKLFLGNNKLSKLPNTLSQLKALELLNLQNNKLKIFPLEIVSLNRLNSLVISGNFLTQLPSSLSLLFALKTLIVDSDIMVHPPAKICSKGSAAILDFMKMEYGLSTHSLNTPRSEENVEIVSSLSSPSSDTEMQASITNYEKVKEMKRQQHLCLEQQLSNHYSKQALLSAEASSNKKHLLQFLSKEHARMEKKLDFMYRQKMSEKEKLVDSIAFAEQNAVSLIAEFTNQNEKNKQQEEFMMHIEKERMDQENMILQKQENLQNIKKNDILTSMENILKENKTLDSIFKKKSNTLKETSLNDNAIATVLEQQIQNIFNERKNQQATLVSTISQEELLQREAYELLCRSKDMKRQRIVEEIQLVEEQLQRMTQLELQQKAFHIDNQLNQLTETRQMLTKLLTDLMNQKKIRDEELHAKLAEIEVFKTEKCTDYWLVKYQLLLDRQPTEIRNKEKELDIEILKIISNAHAEKYIPFFAHHRLTLHMFLQLNDESLHLVGVNNKFTRKAILSEIKKYKSELSSNKWDLSENKQMTPTAPTLDDFSPTNKGYPTQNLSPVDSPTYIKARGLDSECVVCLSQEACFLLLPCGHVCLCSNCAFKVDKCPLDRGPVEQRILIEHHNFV